MINFTLQCQGDIVYGTSDSFIIVIEYYVLTKNEREYDNQNESRHNMD